MAGTGETIAEREPSANNQDVFLVRMMTVIEIQRIGVEQRGLPRPVKLVDGFGPKHSIAFAGFG